MQTYAGPALAEHVVKNAIDWFNTAANGEMVIELYTADQLVPHGELFRAVQTGTIDAAQSDDDSASAPVDVKAFGAYFPLASRYSLDVPALWHWRGLKEIWEEAYAEIPMSPGSPPAPGTPATSAPPSRSAALPTSRVSASTPSPPADSSCRRFGVVPVSLPYEDVEPALQTGELDGICWCGITEMHTVGWANVLKYSAPIRSRAPGPGPISSTRQSLERAAAAPAAALPHDDR
jgi:hypothetical protein